MGQESRIEKIERLFFCIFIFCIPFQTRTILHQWTRPFNEWTSAYLYVTDILLLGILFFWWLRTLKNTRINYRHFFDSVINQKNGFWKWGLALFFVISAISVFYSLIPELALYRLAKLAEFILFFLYIRSNAGTIFKISMLSSAIVGSGLFQAIIAIIQYVKQGSVGLAILGESHIGTNIYNVAVFVADNGVKYIRSYGTTPHPNVLAAWLVLALFAFYFWYANVFRVNHRKQKVQILVLIAYVVILFGLFLTFSRTMIGAWGLAVFTTFIFAKKYREHFYSLALTTIAGGLIFAVFFWPQVKSRIIISGSEEAVTQRILYGEIAGSVTRSNPAIGVGIGQFIPDMLKRYRYHSQYFYQPVHNIYLLISSETGIIGIGAFLAFLILLVINFFKKNKPGPVFKYSILIFTFSFLLIGLFDHFLWTLQQGSFTFWLVLAILAV